MKRISLLLARLRALHSDLVSHASPAAAQTSWQQINIPPLPAFHPQEPKRFVLPNGMVIFLQEDHELPLIDGVARIRGGSRSEPADKNRPGRYVRRSLAHRRHQELKPATSWMTISKSAPPKSKPAAPPIRPPSPGPA